MSIPKTINKASRDVQIKTALDSQKQKILDEHNKALNDMNLKLKSASSTNQIKVKEEYTKIFNGISVDASSNDIEKIKSSPYVKKVYPNVEVHTTLMDSVPLINADDVWQLDIDGNNCAQSGKECLTGKNIKIAIIDTGVDYTHPDLGGCFGPSCKVVGGYDFVNNDNDPMDDHGHGTHVAATAAGNGVLKGVAPDAKIYVYKVLDSSGSGYESQIISGIERAIDPNQDGDFLDHLDIISMSLGGDGNPDDPMSKAVDRAVDNGIVAVIAAGNSGPWENSIGSPGTARKAITVGATDKYDNIAYFSSRGPVRWFDVNDSINYLMKPDVVAPGVNICAAEWDSAWSDRKCFDDKHVSISGTSMATPHVAGAVALIKQAHPDWTPEEIKIALKIGAKKLPYERIEAEGSGRIDVLNSVNITNAPGVAILNETQEASGRINITGTAKGRTFTKYSLYYKNYSNPENVDWNLITSSNYPVENGILALNFDTFLLNEGNNYIKLEVEDGNGIKSEDMGVLKINNIEIKSPQQNDIYKKGDIIQINGSLRGNSPSPRFEVEYSSRNNPTPRKEGITLANEGIGEIANGNIATWNTNYLNDGGDYYNITVKVIDSNSEKSDFVENIYFDSTLRRGWPQRVNWFYDPDYWDRYSQNDLISNNILSLKSQNVISNSNYVYTSIENKTSPEIKIGQINTNVDKSEVNTLSNGVYYWGGFLEPVVADINKDGKKEIIVNSGGAPPKISVFNNDGSVLWERNFGSEIEGVSGGNLHIPLVGDIDGDGYDEIIVSTFMPEGENWGDSNNSEIYAFKSNGDLLWEKKYIDRDFKPGLLMADLDHDGKKEIIIKGNSNYPSPEMIILNSSGETISKWNLEEISWGASIMGSPAVGNFDDDPDLEIVFVSPSKNAGYDWENNSWINEGIISVYNKDGSVVPGWPVYLPGVIFSSPVVGDINKDGKQEIIIGLMYSDNGVFPDTNYGGLYAFNGSGNILPGWPVEKGWNFWSTPSLGDINNDGYLEIAVSRLGFVTYLVNSSGGILNGWPAYTSWNDYYSSIMGDIDNDNKPDVLTTAGGIIGNGGVYSWDLNGLPIENFPKITDADAQAPAVIDDLDGDGKVELVASSDWDYDGQNYKYRSSIYVWDLNATYNKSNMPWPTFMHDPQHTGCYDCEEPISPQPQCTQDSDCGAPTSTTICGGNNVLTVLTTPTCSSNQCTNVTRTYQSKVCAFGCSNGACLKNFLSCENTYYTAWSRYNCNAADCGTNRYVNCERGGSSKRASYREKCSRTYSTQCSETAACNAGYNVIATNPC